MPPNTAYRVRLHFAELEEVGPGERVFDEVVCAETVAEGLDVVREAGQGKAAVVREFQTAATNGTLPISLTGRTGTPILSGVEILAQLADAANAE